MSYHDEIDFIMNTLNNHKQQITDLMNKSVELQKYFPFIKVFPNKILDHDKEILYNITSISAMEYDMRFKYLRG